MHTFRETDEAIRIETVHRGVRLFRVVEIDPKTSRMLRVIIDWTPWHQ